MDPLARLAALRLLDQICPYHFSHKEQTVVSSLVSS